MNKDKNNSDNTFNRRKFFSWIGAAGAGLFAIKSCELLETDDSNDSDNVKSIIQKVKNGEIPFDSITIVYQTGIEYWEFGETTLTIKGDKSALVSNTQSGTTKKYSGTIADSDIDELINYMDAGKFWEIEPAKTKAYPDESTISITFSDSDSNLSQTISLLDSDADMNTDFKPIMDKIRDLIKQISNNEVMF